MPLATDLSNKSVQAAVAAIEVYNSANFSYRESAFALLMSNHGNCCSSQVAACHGDS